jgi:MFS family permease
MASRLFLGRPAAAVGRHHLLVGTIPIFAAGLLLMLIPMPPWLMATLIVITDLDLGAGQPLTMSFLAEAAPPGLRGQAMSLRLTGNHLGQVVIPSTAGVPSPSAPAPPAASRSPPQASLEDEFGGVSLVGAWGVVPVRDESGDLFGGEGGVREELEYLW